MNLYYVYNNPSWNIILNHINLVYSSIYFTYTLFNDNVLNTNQEGYPSD